LAAGSAKPRHTDALPDAKRSDVVTDHINAADNFVTGHNGELGIWQLTIDDMQVGAAHPARRYTNSDFADCRPRIGLLYQLERLTRPFQHHCLHAGKCIA
jgi:hypothetical protein